MKAQSLGSHQLSCGSFLVFLYEKNRLEAIMKIRRTVLIPSYFWYRDSGINRFQALRSSSAAGLPCDYHSDWPRT